MASQWRTTAWIVSILVLLPVAALASWALAGEAESPRGRFEEGSRAVPSGMVDGALTQLSSQICGQGAFTEVVTQGSTTVHNLGLLQPDAPGTSLAMNELSPDQRIYAIVARGSECQMSSGVNATLGYILFTPELHTVMSRGWNEGVEPSLDRPFGEEVQVGLNI